MEPEEVGEAFQELEQAGKVLHFGVSNFNARQLELLQLGLKQKLQINQMQFGIMCTGLISHGLEANTQFPHAADRDGEVLDYCRLKGVTIQAWSPFQYGFFQGVFIDNPQFPELNQKLQELSEKYGVSKSALAVAWILRHPRRSRLLWAPPTGNVWRISAPPATSSFPGKTGTRFTWLRAISCRNQKKEGFPRRGGPFCCHDLSRGFATSAARVPKKMAAVVPAAPAVNPPVNTPKKPSSSTALRTPSDSAQPNPVKGTVAPQPANSASGPYTPKAPNATPLVTKSTMILAGVKRVRSMSSCPTTQMSPPTQKALKYSMERPPFCP